MLTSPLLKSSGTKFTWELLKEHPGDMKFIIRFEDGDYWVWRRIEFHDPEKIQQNIGSDTSSLPQDWLVETVEERSNRHKIERNKNVTK